MLIAQEHEDDMDYEDEGDDDEDEEDDDVQEYDGEGFRDEDIEDDEYDGPDDELVISTLTHDPKEALTFFKLADGYEINLYASEEMGIGNPCAMTFDAQGRLWVSTMPSYPQNKPGEPFKDKIVILEDKNLDGQADHHIVFADDLHLPTGFELGDGGVYVAQQPNLVFLKDTDGDDKADQREYLLHGFGTEDSHHAISAFTWGPGGGLYMQEGRFLRTQVETPYGNVRAKDGAVYRYDPISHKLKVYISYHFHNPWGHVFDQWGQNFIADASDGANYFAAPMAGRLPFPRQHLPIESFTSYVRPTGGCEIVSSRHFPDEAQGDFLITNSIDFHGVKQHRRIEEGSGYTSEELEPLVYSTDENFRPVDVKFGPDGALYILDWYNPIIGHMQYSLRDPRRDHSHGRVWRVTYKHKPLLKKPDIAGQSIETLLELLKVYEDRTRYLVRRELRSHNSNQVIEALHAWVSRLDQKHDQYEKYLLEALWIFQQHHTYNQGLLDKVLKAKNYHVRAAGVRVLRDWMPQMIKPQKWFWLLMTDPHPRVRLEMIVALSDMPSLENAEFALMAIQEPLDYYLEYALIETIRSMESIVKEAIDQSKPFCENNPEGIEFVKELFLPEDQKVILNSVDHAGIISRWNAESLRRGNTLYQKNCARCHGVTGYKATNLAAKTFRKDILKNGSDPYRLFRTLTDGFNNMAPQLFLDDSQRYDIIHFMREEFFKESNPSQYTKVDQEYLDSLPKVNIRKGQIKEREIKRDFGLALASQLENRVSSALTVKLNDDVTICYDLHRMEIADMWYGGFLNLFETQHYKLRGEGTPSPDGIILKGMNHWHWIYSETYDDIKQDLPPRSPLKKEWLDYHGYHVNSDRLILNYDVLGRNVLATPSVSQVDGHYILSHRMEIEAGDQPLTLCVAKLEGVAPDYYGPMIVQDGSALANNGYDYNNMVVSAGLDMSTGMIQQFVTAALVGARPSATLEIDDQHRLLLHIPATKNRISIFLYQTAGLGSNALDTFAKYASEQFHNLQIKSMSSLQAMTQGGPLRWPEVVFTKGQVSQSHQPYVVDTIELPEQNPYGAWMRTSALDFFSDGRCAVSTYGGDVWIVSGIDDKLEKVVWKRFAAGLFEPMGLKVINDQIYVTCRDRIVRLHDYNQDGEADFYESFFADPDVSTYFHAYCFDLVTDEEGYLYYSKSGMYTDYKLPGSVMRISPDGKEGVVWATGLRTPNGMGSAPGKIFITDNQGQWVPSSKISVLKKDAYYGFWYSTESDDWAPDGGKLDVESLSMPTSYQQPMLWIPYSWDMSSASQLWIDDERWGPLNHHVLHTVFTQRRMYYLMMQDVAGVTQASLIQLPLDFDSGLMRVRQNPYDGQVYVVGLTGWDHGNAKKEGCLQRVRYTGKPFYNVLQTNVVAGGIELIFSFELDKESAENIESYSIEQWQYQRTPEYGSPEMKISDPDREGHDQVYVESVLLKDDRKTLFIKIPEIQPVQQMQIDLSNLKGIDGTEYNESICLTIHHIPDN